MPNKEEQIRSRKPKVKMFGIPRWWHHHGSKLVVKEEGSNKLTLASNAASLIIEKQLGKGWVIDYSINHPTETSTEVYSEGRIWMSDQDLERAFMLSTDYPAQGGQHIIDEFGGEAAYQGKFIRYKQWLNMPGPGTGHDGDANISVWVDHKIKVAVRLLMTKVT